MADEPPAATDTTEPIPGPPSRRGHKRWWALGIAVSLVVTTVVALGSIDSHKVAYRPGSASPTDARVQINGTPSFEPEGEILFLTVSVDRLSVLERLLASRDDNVRIVDEDEAFPTSRQQVREENAARMTRAKSDAELLALSYLGYDVYDGAFVTRVVDDGPSKGILTAGDTILAIDGVPTSTSGALVTELRKSKPGQVVSLRVEAADGAMKALSVILGAHPEGRGLLGVELDTRPKATLPVDISIDSGRIGGDSAGLAFTLTILDELTPGELTGDHRVAVTGAIDISGAVLPIGGVEQKVVAARKARAEVMIVPKEDEAAAVAKANGKLRIVAVASLDEALDVLAGLGGNAHELRNLLQAH